MEPRIVEKNEILLIGMPYFGNSSGGEFSETWERFFPYHTWLPGSRYVNSYPYDFELYEDGCFKGMDVEGSEIDLYIPIKQR